VTAPPNLLQQPRVTRAHHQVQLRRHSAEQCIAARTSQWIQEELWRIVLDAITEVSRPVPGLMEIAHRNQSNTCGFGSSGLCAVARNASAKEVLRCVVLGPMVLNNQSPVAPHLIARKEGVEGHLRIAAGGSAQPIGASLPLGRLTHQELQRTDRPSLSETA
jgi:hypothetical protein